MKILWLDTETTGVECPKNDTIQIAGIIEINKKVEQEFNFRCRPINPANVSMEALQIQNRTLDEIRKWPDPKDTMDCVVNVFDQHISKYDKEDKFTVIGHKVQFDLDMIAAQAAKVGFKYLYSYIGGYNVDTLQLAVLARMMGRLNTANLKLETLAKHFGYELKSHDAMNDVRATRAVGQQLLRMVMGK